LQQILRDDNYSGKTKKAESSDGGAVCRGIVYTSMQGMEIHNRKQLYILLATAAWVSLVFLRFYSDYVPEGRDVTAPTVGALVFGAIAFSLPALLFGSILLWWFGKDQ
jgi:hypothetical protein